LTFGLALLNIALSVGIFSRKDTLSRKAARPIQFRKKYKPPAIFDVVYLPSL
jgi:hypothetical protein